MQAIYPIAEISLGADDAISAAIPLGIGAIVWVVKHFATRGGDREKRTYGFEDGIVKALQETITDLRVQLAASRAENIELEKENRALLKELYAPKKDTGQ